MCDGPTAGLGFKPQHFEEAAAHCVPGLWFEVHAENYMVAGGPRLAMLEVLRRRSGLSLHGVGLSLAADTDPDPAHLARLRGLVDRFAPLFVSEHLAWSAWRGVFHPDLLPFPRTLKALDRVARNVEIIQAALGRSILIENPSLYMPLDGQELGEVEFFEQLVRRTGCGLLVDVNNVHVSATNLGYSPAAYLDALPGEAVGEVHLAGHTPDPIHGAGLLIDTHDAPVAEAVWALYDHLIARIGPRPTLIERDGNIPSFGDLLLERNRAARRLADPTGSRREPAHA